MRDIDFVITDEAISDKVDGRKAIFLDTNIWIDLADEKRERTTHIKALLRKLVRSGGIFCPLAPALFWELYKQSYDSVLRVGTLMEELSLNISYASNEEIYTREVENFVYSFVEGTTRSHTASSLYVPAIAYLSSQVSLSFSEEFPEDERERFVKQEAKKLSTMKLLELLRRRKRMFPRRERELPQYSEARKKRREFTKGSKEKARRVEEEYIAQNFILPKMNEVRSRLPIVTQCKFMIYIDSLPKDKYGDCLGAITENMPSLRNQIELLTIAGFDVGRRDSINDFYDVEMMIIPLAYADVFVARDGWIKHLLTRESAIAKRNNTTYIPDLAEFERYLANLQ